MEGGYKKIFWALFFVTFHLNIGPLQLLPPFIGWLILLSGLQELTLALQNSSVSTESFERAKTFGRILVGLTLIGTLGALASAGELMETPIMTFYPMLVIALEITTFFHILQGTHEIFSVLGFKERKEESEGKLRTYLLMVLPSTVLLTFSLFFNHSLSMLIGVLLGLIAVIYLLVFFHQVKKFWIEDPLQVL
jgi:hypothetical protein